MDQASSQQALRQPTARVLITGFRVSAALLLIGLILTAIQDEGLHTSMEGLSTIVDEIVHGRGAGIVALAILVMIVTPIAATIAIVIACVRIGDTLYARIAAAAFIILIISAAISAF